MIKIALLVFFVVFSFGEVTGQSLLINVSKFAWMSGCWEARGNEKSQLISENWMSPAGTSILGMGRTVKENRTVGYEFMRIEVRGMDYYFVAQPMGNATETAFKLTTSQPTSATFENPEHDFPQKIMYWKDGADFLRARIEGKVDGKAESMDFRMKRVKCD